jgi:hypothetical protein
MPETKLVVEHREHLWNLLIQAAQVEHLIMCQYLCPPRRRLSRWKPTR